ncbi:UDP-glucuronosyltransferase 1A1-like [Salminus brasiliensis]|uniref:UDP-glucuronosyltransferase 1A1-like n=1 Tax=Salminus brasiliensis TaxID=930266 RepID=UPI003B835F90
MGRLQSVVALGLLVLLCCSFIRTVEGGKILVMPMDGSHWFSIKILVEELSQKGHEMVVLFPEISLNIQDGNYILETFKTPFTRADLDALMDDFAKIILNFSVSTSVFEHFRLHMNFTEFKVQSCESLLYNESLMKSLKERGFDVILTDPFLPCGSIVADAFSLPVVYFLRGLTCMLDLDAAQCPLPPSYVPRLFSGNRDVMNFPQRVKNMIVVVFESYLCQMLYSRFDELSSRYLQRDTTYKQLLGQGAIWLLRYDFTYEYPRPQMPNMVTIGGINCRKMKALPAAVINVVYLYLYSSPEVL